MSLDISVLFDEVKLDKKAILYIEPLAPLSLVTSMPGSYYRSQREPSKFMIYGMLENLFGWHFSPEHRRDIIKKIKSHHKKKYKNTNLPFDKTQLGYQPLLSNHIKIEDIFLKPYIESYNDYWTQHLKDLDERHAKGNRNYSTELNQWVNDIYKLEKGKRDKAWRELYESNESIFPKYYQSPTRREFIIVNGKYGYPVNLAQTLMIVLKNNINNLTNPIYLGNNEGWIDLKLEEI